MKESSLPAHFRPRQAVELVNLSSTPTSSSSSSLAASTAASNSLDKPKEVRGEVERGVVEGAGELPAWCRRIGVNMNELQAGGLPGSSNTPQSLPLFARDAAHVARSFGIPQKMLCASSKSKAPISAFTEEREALVSIYGLSDDASTKAVLADAPFIEFAGGWSLALNTKMKGTTVRLVFLFVAEGNYPNTLPVLLITGLERERARECLRKLYKKAQECIGWAMAFELSTLLEETLQERVEGRSETEKKKKAAERKKVEKAETTGPGNADQKNIEGVDDMEGRGEVSIPVLAEEAILAVGSALQDKTLAFREVDEGDMDSAVDIENSVDDDDDEQSVAVREKQDEKRNGGRGKESKRGREKTGVERKQGNAGSRESKQEEGLEEAAKVKGYGQIFAPAGEGLSAQLQEELRKMRGNQKYLSMARKREQVSRRRRAASRVESSINVKYLIVDETDICLLFHCTHISSVIPFGS